VSDVDDDDDRTPVEQTRTNLLYVCAICNGPIGMDERSRFVTIDLSEALPYADLILQLACDVEYPERMKKVPRSQAYGALCRRCSDRLAKMVDSIRSTVLSRTGQSS
jgi:hypothetical protein